MLPLLGEFRGGQNSVRSAHMYKKDRNNLQREWVVKHLLAKVEVFQEMEMACVLSWSYLSNVKAKKIGGND